MRALQTPDNATLKRKMTLIAAMAKIRVLLGSASSIACSDHFMKISKLARELQRLSGLFESKDFELQAIPGVLDEAISLQEEISE